MSTRMIYYAFCVKGRPYSLSEIRTIDKAKKKNTYYMYFALFGREFGDRNLEGKLF